MCSRFALNEVAALSQTLVKYTATKTTPNIFIDLLLGILYNNLKQKGVFIMLIDFHCHSSGVSLCAKATYQEVIDMAIEKGIDGLILTNHFDSWYFESIDRTQFIKNHLDEYKKAKEYGEAKGFRVFYGIEVTSKIYKDCHFLIYGVEFDFLNRNPDICHFSLDKMYNAVHKDGGVLIQAHPYRYGCTVVDTDYLDGVEINCHPKYFHSYAERLLEIGKAENKIVTAGSDFHSDTYRPVCGVNLPSFIKDEKMLAEFLKSANSLELTVQEPNEDEIKTLFTR